MACPINGELYRPDPDQYLVTHVRQRRQPRFCMAVCETIRLSSPQRSVLGMQHCCVGWPPMTSSVRSWSCPFDGVGESSVCCFFFFFFFFFVFLFLFFFF